MRILIIIYFLFFSIYFVNAQQNRAEAYIPPLNIPLNVSGTFGELRSNHFHSGIDLKTNEKCGYPVYAIADGYISRIKISPYGFGKAVYIRHKNGFTSVYAHLDSLDGKYAHYLRKQHYKLNKFDIDIYPEKGDLSVKKGDIIAYSGNSGGSEGPHLHFELRENATEKPVNPLLLGIQINDEFPPEIRSFHVYNHFPSNRNRQDYSVIFKNNKYSLSSGDTLLVNNEFSIGLNAIDRISDGKSINGIFDYTILFDSVKVFEFTYDKFAFDETRYANAFIDYEYYMTYKRRIQTSYVKPGNRLSMFELKSNNGIFSIYDTAYHTISLVVKDYFGNSSLLDVVVKKTAVNLESSVLQPLNVFKYNKENVYADSTMQFVIPKGALYENIDFMCSKLVNPNKISPLYKIHSELVPLHSYCTLSIKVDSAMAHDYASKLCIYSVANNADLVYEGGECINQWVTTKTRSFGSYLVDLDTIAPIISAVDLQDSSSVKDRYYLKFNISDSQSGIVSYSAFVDDEWILMDYDAKNNLLTYIMDDKFPKGTHTLKIVVSDEKSNTSKLELVLIN